MAKGKKPPGKDVAKEGEILDAETRRTQRRVAKLRDKLKKAMDDPDMRKQMVNAMRVMMQGDK